MRVSNSILNLSQNCAMVFFTFFFINSTAYANNPTFLKAADCGVNEYISAYINKNPIHKVFADEISQFISDSAQNVNSNPLAKIDKDLSLTVHANGVIDCFDRFYSLEYTLQRLYSLYFNNSAARPAVWLLFKQIDTKYLSQNVRAKQIQYRDNLTINLAQGAIYGTVFASIVLSLRKGKLPAVKTETYFKPVSLQLGNKDQILVHTLHRFNYRKMANDIKNASLLYLPVVQPLAYHYSMHDRMVG